MRKRLPLVVAAGLCGMLLAEPPPEFQNLPKSAVVVRIDGHDVTKSDIQRRAKVLLTLTMNKQRHTKMGKNENALFRRLCASGAQIAVNHAVVAQYAKEKGLTNDTGTVARITRQIERQYGARSKKLKRRHNLGDLKYMLGKNAPLLDAEVAAQATYLTVTNHIITSKPICVTDEMVAKRMQTIADYNNRMALTNALIFARATNVWQQIIGKKMTFEQAATNYSEDVFLEMGCEWGTFGRDQLADDPAVIGILPTLKVADITPPVESDGGLAILRLDEIEQDKNFTFSRVFFRLPMFYDVETADAARAFLIEEAKKDLVAKELDAIKAKMKIEYPSGTNLFAKGTAPLKITKADLAD